MVLIIYRRLDWIADEMLQAAGNSSSQVVIVFIANPFDWHLNARPDLLWQPVAAGEGRKCVNAAAHAHN